MKDLTPEQIEALASKIASTYNAQVKEANKKARKEAKKKFSSSEEFKKMEEIIRDIKHLPTNLRDYFEYPNTDYLSRVEVGSYSRKDEIMRSDVRNEIILASMDAADLGSLIDSVKEALSIK